MVYNVMMVVLNSAYGGTEKHIIDIINNFNTKKYNLLLVVPRSSELANYIKNSNIKVKLIEVKRGLFVIKTLRDIITKFNPNILHFHSPRATFLGFITKKLLKDNKEIKTISTAHGWIPDRLKFAKLFEFLYVHTIKNSDKIIAVSNQVKEQLISNGINANKIQVIYNGIELKEIKKNNVAKDQLTRFVFLGRFINEKGIFHLLDAVKILDAKCPGSFVVDMYGSGPLLGEIESKIKENNIKNVNIKGFVEPLYVMDTLSKYDCFLLPSLQEGFPYTLIEAFASGLAVIASDVGGISEALYDGENGYLIESKNSIQLVDSMEKIINLSEAELNRLKDNAIRMSQKYTVENMVESIQKQYYYLLPQIKEDIRS